MRTLAAAPLRRLVLDASSFGDAHVAVLADHPTLAELALPGLRITARGARALGSLPELRELRLGGCTLDHHGAAELSPLGGRLRSLYLTTAAPISDATCEVLSTFARLERLDLGATHLTRAGLRALTRLRGLQHLSLDCPSIYDAAVRELVAFENLRSLRLEGFDAVTEALFETLAQLPALECLDLSAMVLTNPEINRILSALPNLREVAVDNGML
jgi:hypothetical protein